MLLIILKHVLYSDPEDPLFNHYTMTGADGIQYVIYVHMYLLYVMVTWYHRTIPVMFSFRKDDSHALAD